MVDDLIKWPEIPGRELITEQTMSTDNKKYICIHGHFYQPPRENAWLEQIEVQDSAHPYHDWNERIAAECYDPNGVSRILNDRDRIVDIVNNYAHIDFNFGPTLLEWLEDFRPETYQRILSADRASIEKFGGHGSAMAQVYNHIIMPLWLGWTRSKGRAGDLRRAARNDPSPSPPGSSAAPRDRRVGARFSGP